MKRKFECMAFVACLVLGAAAHAAPAKQPAKPAPMTKPQYEAEKARIDAEYKANGKLCDSLHGEREKVCEVEAKGRADALKAELEAKFKPSPEASQKAKKVTAEANFRAAKAKCQLMRGNAEDRCLKDAKAAREAAIRQAKVEKVRETGGMFANSASRRPVKGGDS